MRIAALAENGLTFSKNPFELDRYKKLRDVAAELFALLTDRPLHELKMELGREVGYVTPKVEVRGALIDEGDRLLMMREVADGRGRFPAGSPIRWTPQARPWSARSARRPVTAPR
jgi:hypothetical protein